MEITWRLDIRFWERDVVMLFVKSASGRYLEEVVFMVRRLWEISIPFISFLGIL